MSNVLQNLNEFLDSHYQHGKPVILGFSGGPDSSALLHSFWKLQRKYALDLHVVHVDHGWREESAREAEELRKYAETLGLPFIVKRLKSSKGKNLEEEARNARFAIFQKTYESLGAQAIALGHQAGDQAETVIKRLLEGSHITKLGAMRNVSLHEKMTVWRPFIHLPKKVLVAYCKRQKIPFLIDKTNRDPRFLRSRMREDLIPMLEKYFGKAIESNLAEAFFPSS